MKDDVSRIRALHLSKLKPMSLNLAKGNVVVVVYITVISFIILTYDEIASVVLKVMNRKETEMGRA